MAGQIGAEPIRQLKGFMPPTAKKTKKVKLHAKAMWGEALHTALRKACDSTPTTIAWNLINTLEDPWNDYLAVLKDQLLNLYKDKDIELWQALKIASLMWDCYKYEGNTRHIAISLKCAFELFEYEDWEGFASYLIPYKA